MNIMNIMTIIVVAFVLLSISIVMAEPLPVYFGTYTSAGNRSKGIYYSTLNLETGRLTDPILAAESTNPSFLAIHPSRKFLYAVGESGKAGAVSAFAIDSHTGILKLLNQQPSGGANPCHVSIDHLGKNLFVANYSSGNASVIPIQSDGRLAKPTALVQHQGSSVHPDRQKGPFAHSINVSLDDRFVFVADLGIDKIMMYKLDSDKGTLVANDPPYVNIRPGAGPRHFTFHPNGKFAYLINELDCTIIAFAYESASGALTEIQTVSTLPTGFKGDNTCAEVCVHPNGKYLYGSNRGHDSIAVFRIDSTQGKLTFVNHVSDNIKMPRHFAIDPTGTFCLVANQDKDNVVVFRIDPKTGTLEPTKNMISIGKPVCVCFSL